MARDCYGGRVASVICLDFDDTVVMDNTARQLFERLVGFHAHSRLRQRGATTNALKCARPPPPSVLSA